MYKTIEKIPDIASYKVYNENIFLRVDNEKYNLQLFKLDFEYNIEWISEEEVVLGFYYTAGKLIYNSKENMSTVCRDDNNKLLYTFNEILYDLYPNSKSILGFKYIGQSEEYDRIIFNLSSGKLEKVLPEQYASLRLIIYKEYIIRYDKSKGQLFLHSNNFTPLWQADLSELCGYELQDSEGFKKAEVNNVLLDGNKVIVLAGLDVVAFAIGNGEILWHCKVGTWQGSRAIIHNGFLYTSNAYFNKIDLSNGKLIYAKEHDYIYLNGEKTASTISDIAWHDDFIWTVMDTSPNALIAIDPKTGKYVEVIPLTDLGITSDCRAPVFHSGKMYLHDYNGTLHIFEEENTLLARAVM